ncbi:MAG TPA: sulfite exporter TauE/SafE family protein [Candidatus Dormibacteraeota bacterium]|nr:sulfite exporter TauE/SafE family protein [Candidatus Dormibacteraeota bacterium]
MSGLQVAFILASGLFAGMVNAIVGSGSLLTFPVLLAVGYSPVVANVSNTVGMAFGNVSGVVGYRRELAGQRARVIGLAVPAGLGAATGALLLLALPETVFHQVVPVLVIFAVALVIAQPWLSKRLAVHRDRPYSAWALRLGVFLTAIYGGYFGAAQGVILVGIMGLLLSDDLQRINGLKNVVAAIVNGVAAVLFVLLAHVAWLPAVLLAVSSVVGGQLGAAVGRRLSPGVLRAVIVVGGLVAVVKLLA